jgi:hypothetical protein
VDLRPPEQPTTACGVGDACGHDCRSLTEKLRRRHGSGGQFLHSRYRLLKSRARQAKPSGEATGTRNLQLVHLHMSACQPLPSSPFGVILHQGSWRVYVARRRQALFDRVLCLLLSDRVPLGVRAAKHDG